MPTDRQPTRTGQPSQTLFDAYLFIDWSSAATKGPMRPKRDQIWIGERIRGAQPRDEKYCRTRHAAIEHLVPRLREHRDAGRRLLIGFDFAYGYPAGFAAALGLPDGTPRWRAIWEDIGRRIDDDESNLNNRFEVAGALNLAVRANGTPGPFWGRPKKHAVPGLPCTSPTYPAQAMRGQALPKYRLTETRVGRGIFSPWQTFYTGSVGGQALTGIPRVLALRTHPEFAAISKVWPFETGFTLAPSPAKGPSIVHAEIWPSLGNDRVLALRSRDPNLIKDRAQVRVLCQWAEELDDRGELGGFFAEPPGLTPDEVETCVQEEGWILGVR